MRMCSKRNEKWWYTGTTPQNTPGFDGRVVRSLPQPRLDQMTKHAALAYFQNGWGLYETLFSSLQGEEAFYRPPQHGLRHPMQFYYGHTAVLFINKAIVAGLLSKPIEPSFEAQFEIGVDEMRWDDMTLGDRIWPRVSQVTEYRREVYRTMVDLLNRHLDSSPKNITWDHPMWSFFMGCEHDRIHLETSSVLIRELPLNLVRKPEFWPDAYSSPTSTSSSQHDSRLHQLHDPNQTPMNELVPIRGQRQLKMGKEKSYPTYGWDNEYGSRLADVADFQVSKNLVSNGEFLEFVKAGGYRERRFWSEDGWGWRRFRNAQYPFFWVRNGPAGSHKYLLRHTFELGDFHLGLPAVVNFHEANAFCEWKAEQSPQLKGLRLLTEAEHQLILDEDQRANMVQPTSDPALLAGGDSLDSKFGINAALSFGSERPVDYHPENKQRVRDSMGNVWQWCEDEMTPFEGFLPHPYYGDFTEPCFDGQHQIIKGGSFVSTADNGANAHCRFHFRPHFLQQSGFRYVLPSQSEIRKGDSGGAVFLSRPKKSTKAAHNKDEIKPQKQQTQQDYESQKMVGQYLALHFGGEDAVIPHSNAPLHALDFPRRCAQKVLDAFDKYSPHTSHGKKPFRALDLGCAVGASTFHLASGGSSNSRRLRFDEVVGIDLSSAFIKTAEHLKREGKIVVDRIVEEDDENEDASERKKSKKDTPVVYSLPKSEFEHRSKTKFVVGDACQVSASVSGRFDAVLGANLLCRLPNPHQCLAQLPQLVQPQGGICVFVSPFSWLSSFTPKDKWLGPVGQSEQELAQEMKSLGFSLCEEDDLPLIIREHRRKYQYIVSHVAVFRNDNEA